MCLCLLGTNVLLGGMVTMFRMYLIFRLDFFGCTAFRVELLVGFSILLRSKTAETVDVGILQISTADQNFEQRSIFDKLSC